MAYKLKKGKPGFQVTREGEFEYHHFEPDKIYDRVPKEEKHLFDEIKPTADRRPGAVSSKD